MSDTTVRDALERIIVGRLVACDEAELRVLDARLDAIEQRRGAERCTADLHWVDAAGVCLLCERDRRAIAAQHQPHT